MHSYGSYKSSNTNAHLEKDLIAMTEFNYYGN